MSQPVTIFFASVPNVSVDSCWGSFGIESAEWRRANGSLVISAGVDSGDGIPDGGRRIAPPLMT